MNLKRPSQTKLRRAPWRGYPARLMRGLHVVCIVFCVAQVLYPLAAAGQDEAVDEYKLKAAMLYNLTQFVEWPASAYPNPNAAISLCILGEDPFANSLGSTIPQEKVKSGAIFIRHLQRDTEFTGCQILYISSSERKTTAHIFSALSGSCVLTVGEMAQFAAHGGMIQFALEDQRVHFDINLNAASRAGLKISSKLLAISQIVKD